VRAELLVSAVVRALGQQVAVEVAQERGESVRVFDLGDVAVPRHLEPVGKRITPVGQHRFEEPRGVHALHRGRCRAGAQDAHAGGAGHDRPHRHGRAVRRLHAVRTEHGEGVTVLAVHDRADFVRVERHTL
jgi:hypothetical protein